MIARLLTIALLLLAPAAQAYDSIAQQAILIDHETGAVLYEKNADAMVHPASMSKLMTAYVVFSQLKAGKISMTDTFPVSQKAWRTGGSKTFVQVGTRVAVEDLVRGMIVQSGNDACIVLAEGIAGSEEKFAAEMTRTARRIGLVRAEFRNATGLEHPEHLMTLRELAQLARRIVDDFPEYYHFYSEREFVYNKIKQGNRNPLLYKPLGVDGLKTGNLDVSGFGLTASAKRDDRRLVMVIHGLKGVNPRSQEGERLLEFGFSEFTNVRFFKRGETVDDAEVWLGVAPRVPLVVGSDAVITLSRKARREMKVVLSYEGPLNAPVAKDAPVGRITVTAPGAEPLEIPVLAGAAVERQVFPQRLFTAINHLLYGRETQPPPERPRRR